MAYKKKKKMMEEVHAIADRLSVVIKGMKKCLHCTICLHSISDPVKTPCGHRFCRECIQTVLQNKNALCPLCNNAINRRSITKDEHMVLYTDQLNKLIQAIDMDLGIDVVSPLSKPHITTENRSSVNKELFEDVQQSKPSCSYENIGLPKKRSSLESNRTTQRQRRSTKEQKAKKKKEPSERSSITKYLSKCGMSGVEPLPPDESNDCQEEKSMDEKVHSWLENLPEIDAFEDPNKFTTGQVGELNLDDTLVTSISQNYINNNTNKKTLEKKADDDVVIVEILEDNNTRPSMSRRFSRSSLRNENNEPRFNDKEEAREYSETKNVERNETKMDLDLDNPKPSTSGITKSSEDSRDRSQERVSDIRRTSPCDLLPAMKKNWCSVKEFGKEMRKRRKKLKSLNVSIENKGKSRSLEEPSSNINVEELIGTDRNEDKNNKKRKQHIEPVSEDIAKTSLDKELFETRRSSGKNKDVLEEHSQRSKNNRSIQEEIHGACESSFIMLEEGEQVHIRNLNASQMNDIIGISEELQTEEVVKTTNDNSKKICDGPSSTPLKDQSKKVLRLTPLKVPGFQCLSSSCNKSCEKIYSLSETPFKELDECGSASKCQSSTPNRRRLSLKKRSTDHKSNNSSSSNTGSRVQAVRRDLSRDINQDMAIVDDRVTSVENKSDTEMSRQSGTAEQKHVEGVQNLADDLTSRRKEYNERDRFMVTFQKLGKIYKHRKKRVKFLYLGRTCRQMVQSFPTPALEKPCNPIDVLDTQDLEGNFQGGEQTPVKNTSTVSTSGREIENNNTATSIKKAKKPVSEPMASSSCTGEIIERSTSKKLAEMSKKVPPKSQDLEVLIVTLNENEQIFDPPVSRPRVSPKKTKDTVKMLSPTKDSQLQFLSLESPIIEKIRTQTLVEKPEPVKDSCEIRGSHSRTLVRASDLASGSSASPCTPRRNRKIFKSRQNLSHRLEMTEGDENEDCHSNHSFSSQATCIRNTSNEIAPIKDSIAIEGCKASATKDADTVSLGSDMDSLKSEKAVQRKVYKRIVPLGSSGTSSPDLVCINKAVDDQLVTSPTFKRKRSVSPDSDVEANLDVIVSSWYKDAKPGERQKKKGKLEETRVPSNSMNANREVRNNSSLRSCSNDRDKATNKLPVWQNKRSAGFAQNSTSQKSSFVATKRIQTLENRMALVVDDDSPDFGATIDKMKDIRSKGFFDGKERELVVENLMQDNFDEVMANVVTDSLMDNYFDEKKDIGSNENVVHVESSGSSGKENVHKNRAAMRDNVDDIDKTLTPGRTSVSNKSLRKDEFIGKVKSVQSTSKMESTRVQLSNSTGHNSSCERNKLPLSAKVSNDSTAKDTFEQDSLMNITQHDLMIKQFEEYLFGKSKNSNTVSKKEETKEHTPVKKRKMDPMVNAKDVEHSGEEDDIVENTPDTKTKTRSIQGINSSKDSQSSLSQMFEEQFPTKTPSSTTEKGSSAIATPACKRKMHPIYQSTPKTNHTIPSNNFSAAKTISTINESFNNGTKVTARSSTQNVQSFQSPARQKLCFVCSGLLSPQVEQVKRLCEMANVEYLMQFNHEVTHVIVKADQKNNGANKTLKYLQGIAHRKWIVSYQWVLDSLQKSSLINEEPYEVVDCRTLEAGPRKSRLREKDLFEDFAFVCIGPYNDVSVEQYQDLLRASGAIVVSSLDALNREKERMKFIVVQADVYESEILEWYNKTRAVPIVHEWVIECISQYKLISFYPYLLELSRQDVLNLGYPEHLVDCEADGDSDSMCDDST